jgi:multidrug efflux pump
MNPSRTFILRPVATSLLTAGILLAGMVAYLQLPISALPQVDYPTIQVLTFYPGAGPDVMASAVTTPLERQLGQLPGLSKMTSTSSSGASLITMQFNLDLNIDVAEQQVQAAINVAATFLPRDLPAPPIYNKVNPADSPILTLAVTSDALPLTKVEDLADTILARDVPAARCWPGEHQRRPAAGDRVKADPDLLASYGLSLEDRTVLGQANVDAPRATSRARGSRSASGPTTRCSRPRSTRPWSSPTATARPCACPTWRA